MAPVACVLCPPADQGMTLGLCGAVAVLGTLTLLGGLNCGPKEGRGPPGAESTREGICASLMVWALEKWLKQGRIRAGVALSTCTGQGEWL